MTEIGVNTEIGGYRVAGLIGQGGMGTVYLAEQVHSGEQVALKVLAPELADNEEYRTRFLREAGYATSVDHPNVVKVRDAGEADGVLYLVMDYIEGMDLGTTLALDGELGPERTLALLEPVAAALDAIHATGLRHRDVKPANVIVANAPGGLGQAYVTDFGLSKNPSKDSRALTADDAFVGTFHYTAPEEILGRDPDHRMDVYSLGCLLYQCLVGYPPFGGRGEAELLHAHIDEPPPKPSEQRPELPPELDSLVARAMAKEPGDRYNSCGELIDALRGVVGPAEAPAAPGAQLRIAVYPGSGRGRVELEPAASSVALVCDGGRWRFVR